MLREGTAGAGGVDENRLPAGGSRKTASMRCWMSAFVNCDGGGSRWSCMSELESEREITWSETNEEREYRQKKRPKR